MNNNARLYTILLIILLIPAFIFFFKPEVSLDNKFIKFSWNQGYNEVATAIKNKKSGELLNKIYGNLKTTVDPTHIRQSMIFKYTDYLGHSKIQVNRFKQKWKVFTS